MLHGLNDTEFIIGLHVMSICLLVNKQIVFKKIFWIIKYQIVRDAHYHFSEANVTPADFHFL